MKNLTKLLTATMAVLALVACAPDVLKMEDVSETLVGRWVGPTSQIWFFPNGTYVQIARDPFWDGSDPAIDFEQEPWEIYRWNLSAGVFEFRSTGNETYFEISARLVFDGANAYHEGHEKTYTEGNLIPTRFQGGRLESYTTADPAPYKSRNFSVQTPARGNRFFERDFGGKIQRFTENTNHSARTWAEAIPPKWYALLEALDFERRLEAFL